MSKTVGYQPADSVSSIKIGAYAHLKEGRKISHRTIERNRHRHPKKIHPRHRLKQKQGYAEYPR